MLELCTFERARVAGLRGTRYCWAAPLVEGNSLLCILVSIAFAIPFWGQGIGMLVLSSPCSVTFPSVYVHHYFPLDIRRHENVTSLFHPVALSVTRCSEKLNPFSFPAPAIRRLELLFLYCPSMREPFRRAFLSRCSRNDRILVSNRECYLLPNHDYHGDGNSHAPASAPNLRQFKS